MGFEVNMGVNKTKDLKGTFSDLFGVSTWFV